MSDLDLVAVVAAGVSPACAVPEYLLVEDYNGDT